MMTNKQYLLLKLSEECNEVGQMASKNMHFGTEETQTGGIQTNRERLHDEINDLLAIIELLNEEEGFNFTPDPTKIADKKHKVKYYREYSRSLGLVEEEKCEHK